MKKKWDLGNGVYAEDLVYEYGANCNYEKFPSHSFIIDVDDNCWKEIFTSEQLEKISSDGTPTFVEHNNPCQEMFTCFTKIVKSIKSRTHSSSSSVPPALFSPPSMEEEELIIDALWKKLTEYASINPRMDFDKYWLQKAMSDILDLYRWRIIDWVKSSESEMDYTTRLWSITDKVFDNLFLEAKRDSSSVATTIVDNKDRVITGKAPLPRKVSSIRPNLVISRNGNEYGAAECRKDDDYGVGKNEVVGTGLHSHKVLKRMMLQLADKCDRQEDLLRSLRIVFLGQSHTHMHVDSPGGYICRVRSTPRYEIGLRPSLISSGVLQILQRIGRILLIIWCIWWIQCMLI
ncbi:hypothetical protein BDC45DRAFT_290915 [Circinella umbellata]|nr:hypothetical protein BDC45DRAFT_290915 [Circinella umbellata]